MQAILILCSHIPLKTYFLIFLGALFTYEIKNKKLRELVEKKARETNRSVDEVIWGYINRGLMDDAIENEVFEHSHSKEFLNEVNDALGVD